MIYKFKKSISAVILTISVFGCKGAFEFNPNQITLNDNEKGLTSKNIEKIKAGTAKDTVRFIVTGDTHQWLDETTDFVKSVNTQKDISFVVHLGDVTASGITQEFKWFNEIMSGLKCPYLTVAGYLEAKDKVKIYNEMFGQLDYSFDFGGNKFILINTNSKALSSNGSVPNIAWLQTELAGNTKFDATVILGHVPPFDTDFDKNLEKNFADILDDNPTVKFSLFAHQHAFSVTEPYQDGVKYYVTSGVKQKNYLIVSLWKTGYRVDSIPF